VSEKALKEVNNSLRFEVPLNSIFDNSKPVLSLGPVVILAKNSIKPESLTPTKQTSAQSSSEATQKFSSQSPPNRSHSSLPPLEREFYDENVLPIKTPDSIPSKCEYQESNHCYF
jgi:hypothetical protein